MRGSNLEGQWTITLRDGTQMTLPRSSSMAWATAFRGVYDPLAYNLLRSYIVPHSVVLDIGAALGLWTVPLAMAAMACESEVWAFEPLPGNHPWLESNIAANGLTNVTLEKCALGTKPGVALMMAAEGLSGNAAIQTTGFEGDIEVPVRVLDENFAFPARVSAVKIDVEGYELQVLTGATKMIDRDRPVIFGEFNREWIRRRDEDLDAFLNQLHGRDYLIYGVELCRARPWMAPSRTRLHEYAGTEAEELLLVPRERLKMG